MITKFIQPPLPFSYDAYEPFIDAKTMEVHYSKHHATYTAKFNEALEGIEGLENKTAEEILKNLDLIPEAKKQAVINHGGGFLNHNLYWEILSPEKVTLEDKSLISAIDKTFESFEKFKEVFSLQAMGVFGSGWAWLVKDNETQELQIKQTSNQDNPISKFDVTPILAIDVWEHAYYLKHQNKRDSYVADWWNLVNWEAVASKFNL